MKRTFFAVGLTTLLLVATLAAAACGGDDDADGQDMGGMADGSAPAGSIEVKLINWAVEPAKTSAPAGKVTFWAVHDEAHGHDAAEGGVTHDLQVMKKKADGSFEMVGQVQGLKMGDAKALTLTLQPGEYDLACNVVEDVAGKMVPHYTKGMHTAFTVTK